jgi:hypothetical protein
MTVKISFKVKGFLSFKNVHNPPIQRALGRGAFLLGYSAGREVDYIPLSRAEVKSAWKHNSELLYALVTF